VGGWVGEWVDGLVDWFLGLLGLVVEVGGVWLGRWVGEWATINEW